MVFLLNLLRPPGSFYMVSELEKGIPAAVLGACASPPSSVLSPNEVLALFDGFAVPADSGRASIEAPQSLEGNAPLPAEGPTIGCPAQILLHADLSDLNAQVIDDAPLLHFTGKKISFAADYLTDLQKNGPSSGQQQTGKSTALGVATDLACKPFDGVPSDVGDHLCKQIGGICNADVHGIIISMHGESNPSLGGNQKQEKEDNKKGAALPDEGGVEIDLQPAKDHQVNADLVIEAVDNLKNEDEDKIGALHATQELASSKHKSPISPDESLTAPHGAHVTPDEEGRHATFSDSDHSCNKHIDGIFSPSLAAMHAIILPLQAVNDSPFGGDAEKEADSQIQASKFILNFLLSLS